MVIAFIANVLVAPGHILYQATLVVQLVLYGSATIGAITDRFGKNVFPVSLTFSFCLAMIGMTLGLAKAIAGRAPSSYKTE
jgi:hypothetical protein